jgi:hypothetical protein
MNPAQERLKKIPHQLLRSPIPPQAETVAPAVEASLPEASILEGEYTVQMQSSSNSSRSPW